MDTDNDKVRQIKGSDSIDLNTPQRRRPADAQFGLKALIIIALSLVLLIPVLMIGSLDDRKALAADVTSEIKKGAGGDLEIAGPFLAVSVEQRWRSGTEAQPVMVWRLFCYLVRTFFIPTLYPTGRGLGKLHPAVTPPGP